MNVEPGGAERGRNLRRATLLVALLAGCLPFAVPETVFSFGSTASRIGVGLLGAGLVVLATAVPAVRCAIRSGAWRRAGSRKARGAALRIVLYGACGGLAACSIVPMPAGSDVAEDARTALFRGGTCLGLGLAAHVLAARVGRSDAARRSAPARIADVTAWNVVAALFVVESVLLGMARFAPSPWLYDDSTAAGLVRAHLLRGGSETSGFRRVNSRGFPDDEFFAAGRRDDATVLVADSFGVGVVAHEHNFATVAERILAVRLAGSRDRVAVHNVSVTGAGLREYRYLLEREGLPLRPTRVVLCLFVGNDVTDRWTFGQSSFLESHRRLQDWTLWTTCRNLLRAALRIERGFDGRSASGEAIGFDEQMERARTQPGFTEEAFLDVERARVGVCGSGSGPAFEVFFDELGGLVRSAGPEVLVVVIPDEFQVNEALLDRVVEPPGPGRDEIELERPQRLIGAWCAAQGVECLDLLPVLRAAERIRPTYHLRDTHWNAWGNLVAGRALAAALLDGVEAHRIEDCLGEP